MAIQVGDLVRFKNSAIAAKHPCAPCGRTRYKRGYKHFRGKQEAAKVLRILQDHWDWRSKTHNRIVELDTPDKWLKNRNKVISTHLLAVVKKAKKTPAP